MKYNTNLSKLRARLGITPMQMAKKLQIPKTNYYYYESGDRLPKMDVGIKIADTLGVKNLREIWPPTATGK